MSAAGISFSAPRTGLTRRLSFNASRSHEESGAGSAGPPVATQCQQARSGSAANLLPRERPIFGERRRTPGRPPDHRSAIQSIEHVLTRQAPSQRVHLSRPMFEPFLLLDGGLAVIGPFDLHEVKEPVTIRGYRSIAPPMFRREAGDVGRYADTERAERLVGQDVNPAADHPGTMADEWSTNHECNPTATASGEWRDVMLVRMARTSRTMTRGRQCRRVGSAHSPGMRSRSARRHA